MSEIQNDNKSLKKKSNSKGASMVEYALLVALIAVIAIVAVKVLGQRASEKFSDVSSNLT